MKCHSCCVGFFSSTYNWFRFRKRSTVVESLSNLVSKQSVDQLSEGKWFIIQLKWKKLKNTLPMCTNILNSVTWLVPYSKKHTNHYMVGFFWIWMQSFSKWGIQPNFFLALNMHELKGMSFTIHYRTEERFPFCFVWLFFYLRQLPKL